MAHHTTWLDQPQYRWIKEHLLQRAGDCLLYRALAAGVPETPLPECWAPPMREVGLPQAPPEDW